ncbi:MAG: tetratricopeptide repeat protein, partial [Bacteroidetes bacterium]|nr:tetratricopeptide repeat protein [Bacteroidota bacterium]
LTQNQIRAGLLDLLREIEQQDLRPEIKAEVENAVSIVNSKNVVAGSNISAGGSVVIGDKNETHHHYGDRKIPRALTPNPFQPEVFIGREDDLQAIYDQLFTPGGNLLLLVNGDGGVGKTTLASKYYHRYQADYAHYAWVLSEKNMAAALLLLAVPLGLQFGERMPTAERLQMLLAALAALDRPCLLVIDNANEPEDLEAHYLHLRCCGNFHLLLTSRITEFGQAGRYRIEGLPEGEALELFRKYCPKLQPGEEAIFKQIRTAVGGNTLVMELLAKNLALFNRLKTRYTLADLLADLQKKGLLHLSQSQAVPTDYQSRGGAMRREKPEDIIAAMYDLSGLPPEAVALLSVFAVLPAESIGSAMLETLLPGTADLDDRLLDLAQNGWIDMKEVRSGGEQSPPPDADLTYFKCSPVVQEITKEKNKGRLLEDCRRLVDALNKELDVEVIHLDNYQHSTQFARYAEAVVEALNRNDYDLAILCQNIGNFHIATGELGNAMSAYQKMADIQSALIFENPDNPDYKNGLAISYSKLGETHTALGDLTAALRHFEEFAKLMEELYAAYPQNVSYKNGLAVSYSKLGDTHTELGDLTAALRHFEKDIELSKELYAAYPQNVSFKNGLAISYSQLGETHTALGDLTAALRHFEERSRLGKELYAAYPQNVSFKNGLAISYSQLGRFYRDKKNDRAKARLYFEQCQALWQELAKDYPGFVEFQRNLNWVQNALAGLE